MLTCNRAKKSKRRKSHLIKNKEAIRIKDKHLIVWLNFGIK